MGPDKSPSLTHPSCTSVDKLTMTSRQRCESIDRPNSQPFMSSSRISTLVTKPDRSSSFPMFDSTNTHTPRLSMATHTRPWRPGSVSPLQTQSETRLPNPKLAKLLDRGWKSSSVLPNYPLAGPEVKTTVKSGSFQDAHNTTTQTCPLSARPITLLMLLSSVDGSNITENSVQSNGVNTNSSNSDDTNNGSNLTPYDIVLKGHDIQIHQDILVPRLSVLARKVADRNTYVQEKKQQDDDLIGINRVEEQVTANEVISTSPEEVDIVKKNSHHTNAENPIGKDACRLSFVAGKIALQHNLKLRIKGEEAVLVTETSFEEIPLPSSSNVVDKSRLQEKMKLPCIKQNVDKDESGWNYYSTERAQKILVAGVLTACEKQYVEEKVTLDKDIETKDQLSDRENSVGDVLSGNQTAEACEMAAKALVADVIFACEEEYVEDMAKQIDIEGHLNNKTSAEADAFTEPNIQSIDTSLPILPNGNACNTGRKDELSISKETKDAATVIIDIQTESRPITERDCECDQRKKKVKQKKPTTRVDEKIDRHKLDCLAENSDGLSNSDALDMINAIFEEDKEAAKMLEELRLLTKLEQEQEDKINKSKEEEDHLVAELDKYKNNLAETIEKKKRIDERLLQIYKKELNPETEYGVIEDYLLAESLAKTYHEKRNFEECSIAYLEHQLQTRVDQTNLKLVKKTKEPKIKPRMTKNALRLQKDKGNKIRQEKIQKFEEEFKNGERHKNDKNRKGMFFKEPADNNYKPMPPGLQEKQNKEKQNKEAQKKEARSKSAKREKYAPRQNNTRKPVFEASKKEKLSHLERKILVKRHKESKIEEKRSAKIEPGLVKRKNSLTHGDMPGNVKNQYDSKLKQAKTKQVSGQMKVDKADNNRDVKLNTYASTKTVKPELVTTKPKSANVSPFKSKKTMSGLKTNSEGKMKDDNGHFKRPKIEPNKLRPMASQKKDRGGSKKSQLPLPKAQHGEQTQAKLSGNSTYSKSKPRDKLPIIPKSNAQRNKTANTKQLPTFSKPKPDFVF